MLARARFNSRVLQLNEPRDYFDRAVLETPEKFLGKPQDFLSFQDASDAMDEDANDEADNVMDVDQDDDAGSQGSVIYYPDEPNEGDFSMTDASPMKKRTAETELEKEAKRPRI